MYYLKMKHKKKLTIFILFLFILYYLFTPLSVDTMRSMAEEIYKHEFLYAYCVPDDLFSGPKIETLTSNNLTLAWEKTEYDMNLGALKLVISIPTTRYIYYTKDKDFRMEGNAKGFVYPNRKPTNKYDAHCKTEPQTKDSK